MHKNDEISDSKLWEKLKSNQQDAYIALFDRYADLLYAYGIQMGLSSALCEDCLQETFLKLWENRHKLPDVKKVKAYLLIMMRNLAFTLSKKEKNFFSYEEQSPKSNEISPEESVIIRQGKQAQSKKIQEALRQLTPRQREIVYLRFFSGADYEEICEIMEIDYQSARDLLYRSIKKLRKVIISKNLKLVVIIALLGFGLYFL